MCGIVGITSNEDVIERTLLALTKLEYRGYDSYGAACFDGGKISISKDVGSIRQAVKAGMARSLPTSGTCLTHTRWATHGDVTKENAHPHLSFDGRFAIVHNGVIENYAKLRLELERDGIEFRSETDSEVIAHLIARSSTKGQDIITAISATCGRLVGEYAIGVVAVDEPTLLFGARHKSPLLIAIEDGRGILASDKLAVGGVRASLAFVEDGDVVCVSASGAEFYPINAVEKKQTRTFVSVEETVEEHDRGLFPHFMIKEIHDIPNAIRSALVLPTNDLRGIITTSPNPVTLIGAGSAF